MKPINPTLKTLSIHLRNLAICIALGTGITLIINHKFDWDKFAWGCSYGTMIGFSLWKGNELTNTIIGRIIPWEKNPKKAFLYNGLSTLLFSLTAILLINYIWFEWFTQRGFVNSLYWLKYSLLIQFATTVIISLSFYTANFFKYWRLGLINEQKLKQEALAYQYEALKNQVNPHFLFNSLNVLTSLVETNPQMAVKFIKQLSEVYRYVLDQKDKEIVALETEMLFVNNYLFLQKIRFDKGLDYIEEKFTHNHFVVPVSVQMLVENALKHNALSLETPLKLKIYQEGDYLVVKNNLQKRSMVNVSGNIGLENIMQRYRFLTQKEVIVEENEHEFKVKLPLLKKVEK